MTGAFAEQDIEIVRRDYRDYQPEYHTGWMQHLWGGWEWVIEDGRRYRTDGVGDGLWIWSENDLSWRQLMGTSQFSLSRDRARALRQLKAAKMPPRTLK
jgi:hypothetical protein